MWILKMLSKIFSKKQKEALQSASKPEEDRFKALQSASISDTNQQIQFEKDSFQLGIAAGYTGRAIKEIESSLIRIESQMTTKDWFLSQFNNKMSELIELIKLHEQNEMERFKALQSASFSTQKFSEYHTNELKMDFQTNQKMPLTGKMLKLIEIVKSNGEISYEELAKQLNLKSVSGLRGLLSNLVKRTGEIERIEKDGKGWVRYIASNHLDSNVEKNS